MRTYYVTKARKPQGRCEKCGQDIPEGSAYKYVKPRYGGKRKRHASCPSWRPSELTSSKLATAYAAQEEAEDALNAIDVSDYISVDSDGPSFDEDGFLQTVRDIVAECESAAQECASEYEDSIQNMPENLQYGDVAEQMREKIDALESWGDECSSFDPNVSFDEPERDDDDDDEQHVEAFRESVETFAQDVYGEALDVIQQLEV